MAAHIIYTVHDETLSYTLWHIGKCGVVRKEEQFKTLRGLERAYDRALKEPQKYAYNRNGLSDPIISIKAIQWKGIHMDKTLAEFCP